MPGVLSRCPRTCQISTAEILRGLVSAKAAAAGSAARKWRRERIGITVRSEKVRSTISLAIMPQDPRESDAFEKIDQLLHSGDAAGAFEFLIEHFRRTRDYRALFEARLMRRRLDLGLPLYQLRD